MRDSWILELEGTPGGRISVGGSVRIGRDASMDVVILSSGVADHHVSLLRDREGWWIEPAADRIVGCNGERLRSRRRLAPGDRLALGSARLNVIGAAGSTGPGPKRRWLWLAAVALLCLGGLAKATSSLQGAELPVGGDPGGASPSLEGCSDPSCREEADRLHRLGKRLWEERDLGPGRAFDAWIALGKARGILGTGAAGQQEILAVWEEVAGELERRCGSLQFTFSRHLALKEFRRARSVLRELREAFPSAEHPCHERTAALESELEALIGAQP